MRDNTKLVDETQKNWDELQSKLQEMRESLSGLEFLLTEITKSATTGPRPTKIISAHSKKNQISQSEANKIVKDYVDNI